MQFYQIYECINFFSLLCLVESILLCMCFKNRHENNRNAIVFQVISRTRFSNLRSIRFEFTVIHCTCFLFGAIIWRVLLLRNPGKCCNKINAGEFFVPWACIIVKASWK